MSDPQTPRRADRVPLLAEVNIRRAGMHPFRVRIFDASPQGCKMEFVERPLVGDRAWIKFEGLQSIEATVRWVEGHIGGVEFDPPIHEAVFARLASGSTS